MAQPEAGMGDAPRDALRLRLNMFPRPAKAKLINVRKMSFFMVPLTYEDRFGAQPEIGRIPGAAPSLYRRGARGRTGS